MTSLLALLALASPAHAVDLSGLVEAWTLTLDGQAGNDGQDEALGVALTATGQIVAVGFLDGAAGHERDGYAVSFEPSGAVAWELLQDVGPVGVDRTSSDDRLYGVAVEPLTDALALCGRRGGEAPADPIGRYLVETFDAPVAPYPPGPGWTLAYVDGATSPVQECRGVAWTGGHVYAAGWSDRAADAGRWLSWKLDEASSAAVIPPLTFDATQFPAVPDQAYDVAVHPTSGGFAIVGARGFAGTPGSLLNDTDWYVRYHDAAGALIWQHTFQGPALLDDRALSVDIDVLTGDVVVGGWTNGGDDNGPGADLDWLVIRYDDAGDGLGGPAILWSQTWESATGASEGATAVAFDDFGDVLVGGFSIDPGTGVERWRVAKWSGYDGLPAQEWLGAVPAADSRIQDLDFRDGRIAVAGYVDQGAGRDFAATFLDGDLDFDGTADSVDACPSDANKAADEGICGCGVPDVDTDGDGLENCLDGCPTDGGKTEAGVCGCEEPDDDSDGDGTLDCQDDCPDDPDKTAWGTCGCGAPDTDTDGDGVLGCDDACANTPPGTEVDGNGCPIEEPTDTGDPGTEPTDGEADKGGCGCATPTPSGALGGLALVALAAARRRRIVNHL